MNPFFSIIIPVYNVAPYLRECLDSVLAQTFTDWEAICVDDGSSDGSGVILDEYAEKDSRFRVIHQPNAGVSVARNAALSVAKGEWFLFLDGDDALRQDGLELFIPYIRPGECDGILIHPYISPWHGGEIPDRKIQTCVLEENASREDLIFGPYAANGFVISRIYKKTVFGHLRFSLGVKMAEDVCFWFDALCLNAKWKIVNAEYYLYRQRADSVCGKKSPKDCEAVLDSVLYACNRISLGMGMGDAGSQRYIKRWPYSPSEYLTIFIARRRELDSKAKCAVLTKTRELVRLAGEWPFTAQLRCDLWLVEHHSAALIPLFHYGCKFFNLFIRCRRLMHHISESGIAFAFGKVKRQIMRQGEYSSAAHQGSTSL